MLVIIYIYIYFVLVIYIKYLLSEYNRLMQKLKTRVIKKDVNPEWNEDLTLSVTDPKVPVKLVTSSLTLIIHTRDLIQKTQKIKNKNKNKK